MKLKNRKITRYPYCIKLYEATYVRMSHYLFIQPVDPVVRSLIMAVAVCYHARLQEREDFETSIVNEFLPPFVVPEGKQQFVNEIFM